MEPQSIFVDLQGFKNSKNEFIIKELAIATKDWTQVFIVKPPYAYSTLTKEEKKQVNWLERNRGILWSEGFIDNREFKRLIQLYLENKNIFVKGCEKVKWVKKICENCNIVDLGEKGCPNLSMLQEKYKNCELNCISHKKQCALKICICLRKWFYDNHLYQFKFFTK